ncbi:MAG: ribosome-binding factor [Anaerocolumna sp.]|jgi:ribosome-binding factor A|nr:ribosome-binding factor [Anaerocolumna sp.]
MRKNSIKNTRINGEVQRELSTLISREIKDPRINPMTSVVAVDVAPDLKHAKVYISVLGDEDSRKNTLAGLRSAAPYMRSQLARSINLRNTPELTFVMDQSIEYGVNMSKLIDEVNKDHNHNENLQDTENEDEDDFEDEDDVEDEVFTVKDEYDNE